MTQEIGPDTSDGYHTFAELYHYRMLFNALLFNEWAAAGKFDVHKAYRHSDGSMYGGWFIVVAQLPTGQISNHYSEDDWDRFKVPERGHTAEWDGHTAEEAAKRMAAWLDQMPSPAFPEVPFDLIHVRTKES
ncbi:WDGH domain-containing protein [Nocardia sp. NBC_01327]|uniref:WDGH domain-containing protein n=1 Tax=Nocardia sp. NBC_01327 TaxID=2903593 RepID=UPI002E0F9EDD|nr:hypothetical protein OG326_23670 [Nocardia sp. NBC_01327]